MAMNIYTAYAQKLREINRKLSDSQYAKLFIEQGKLTPILENIHYNYKKCVAIDDIDVVCETLDVMTYCAKVCIPGVFEAIEAVGAVKIVAQCMTRHSNNMKVQYSGLLTILALSRHNKFELNSALMLKSVCGAIILEAAVKAVEKAVEAVPIDEDMVEMYVEMMTNLLIHTTTRKGLKDAGVLTTMNEMLLYYANINSNDCGDDESVICKDLSSWEDVPAAVEHIGGSRSISFSSGSGSSKDSIISISLDFEFESLETVLNKFVICERMKDFIYKIVAPGDAAQKMCDFDPYVFIKVIFIPRLYISVPETICLYNLINFCAQQALNNQWQGRKSAKWARLNENEIVFKISRVPSPLSLVTCTDEETNEFFSLQGHQSLVFMKSKLKMRQLNIVKLGIESLGINMKFKVKLSSTNEKKWISVDDKGAIYEDKKYIASFAHNENYIDRDSVIQFDAFKKNKRNVKVCFSHYKKDILISQSATINLRFSQTSKKMKMVGMVKQMDGHGIYYL